MKLKSTNTKTGLRHISKIHIGLAAVFAIQIMIYDAYQLVTPDVVLKRWGSIALIFVVAFYAWYIARTKNTNRSLMTATWLLVLADIAVASFNVYTQRGMASRAVILYILPIIAVGILRQKTATLFTAGLCVAAYVLTSVAYFVLNFNEGYKIELYGEIGFYSAVLIISALLTSTLLSKR